MLTGNQQTQLGGGNRNHAGRCCSNCFLGGGVWQSCWSRARPRLGGGSAAEGGANAASISLLSADLCWRRGGTAAQSRSGPGGWSGLCCRAPDYGWRFGCGSLWMVRGVRVDGPQQVQVQVQTVQLGRGEAFRGGASPPHKPKVGSPPPGGLQNQGPEARLQHKHNISRVGALPWQRRAHHSVLG